MGRTNVGSPLDARIKFSIGAVLDEQHQEAFWAIPGVFPKPTKIDAPMNAGWIVEAILRSWGYPFVAILPKSGQSDDADVVEAKAESIPSEAHRWLWADPATSPATVQEPIRLLDYQRAAIDRALARGGGHFWAPPGSGKTVVAHAWALARTADPIVIVTRSDARETHRRELVACTTTTPFDWKPKHEVRKADRWPSIYDYLLDCATCRRRPVVIVGWERLPQVVDLIIAELQPGAVVFDESHRAKGARRLKWHITPAGKRDYDELPTVSRAAWHLAKAVPFRFATTATAIRHRTWDLWGQASLVEPRAWGKTITAFAKRYCGARPGEFGGLDMTGMTNPDELRGRLAFTVDRVPYAVLASRLPPKQRRVIRIPVVDQIAELRRDAEEAAEIRKVKAAAAKGDQRAADLLYEVRIEDAASRKRRAVGPLVEEWLAQRSVDQGGKNKGKVIVLTGRHRDCEDLGARLAPIAAKASAGFWWAHGERSSIGGGDASDRQAIQDAYMAHPGPALLVGTIDSWGESRNLHDSDVLCCVQLPDTPGKIDQLEGRGQRLGMTRPLLIVFLVAEETIDERVAALVIDKLPAVAELTDGGALGGLARSLKGLDDEAAVEASLSSIFDGADGFGAASDDMTGWADAGSGDPDSTDSAA